LWSFQARNSTSCTPKKRSNGRSCVSVRRPSVGRSCCDLAIARLAQGREHSNDPPKECVLPSDVCPEPQVRPPPASRRHARVGCGNADVLQIMRSGDAARASGWTNAAAGATTSHARGR
jgi:hypothetical protein